MHLLSLSLHARTVSDVAELGDTQYTILQVNGDPSYNWSIWTKRRLARVSSGPISVYKPVPDDRRKPGNYHLDQTTLSI